MLAILNPKRIANFLKLGRFFYAIGIICIGIQQVVNHSLSQVIVPDWPKFLQNSLSAYLFGIVLTVLAVLLFIDKMARHAGMFLGLLLLLLFLFVQVSNQLFILPYKFHLGLWTNPLKELALSGGAFLVAASIPPSINDQARSKNLMLAGRVFFSITMIAFGIDHFLYPDFVASLVPEWIPGHLFWTYLGGVALIGLGLALLIRLYDQIAGLLLAGVLIIWLVVLHIPRAIVDPHGDKGNELTSVFEALTFAGIALLLAGYAKTRKQ